MPRPNMYQSLHTSVIAGGQPFEVQIRTAEMHRIAEEGIAAHWKYKDGKLVADDREDQRVSWLRHLVEWQQEMKDPADFLSTLENRSLSGRGLHLHAERQGHHAAARRDAGRFRLRHSHRSRPHLCRREDQRPHDAAEDEAEEWRHRRNRDAARPQAQPRLAVVRQDLARSQQDPALAHRAGKRKGDRTRAKDAREGSAQVQEELRKTCSTARSCKRCLSEYGSSKVEDLLSAIGYGKISAKQILVASVARTG